MLRYNPRRSISFYLVFLILVCNSYFLYHKGLRLLTHHNFDLDYETLFATQFAVYVLTHDCQRLTSSIVAHFDRPVTVVPDVHDSPHCKGLGNQLLLNASNQTTDDDEYRYKYASVLEHCLENEKVKCLLLEDDVLFLHKNQRNQEVIVENTLELFNGHLTTYDCTKRGFGWISSTPNGQGSQCRIFGKGSCACMRDCVTEVWDDPNNLMSRLDTRLHGCSIKCGLDQRRFLLVQHTGLTSAMQRGQSEEVVQEKTKLEEMEAAEGAEQSPEVLNKSTAWKTTAIAGDTKS